MWYVKLGHASLILPYIYSMLILDVTMLSETFTV